MVIHPESSTSRTAEQSVLSGLSAVFSVVFSPDGQTLAFGSLNKTIRLWDVSTGAERSALSGHTDYVRSVAFSSERKWASVPMCACV